MGQRTAGMQYWRDERLEGCKTGGMQVRYDELQEGCRKGGMTSSYDSRIEGFRTGEIHEMSYSGLEGFWTRGIQERRDAGKEGYRTGVFRIGGMRNIPIHIPHLATYFLEADILRPLWKELAIYDHLCCPRSNTVQA